MRRAKLLVVVLLAALMLIGCQEKEETKAVTKTEEKEGKIEPGKTISLTGEVELPKTTAKEYIEAEKGVLYTKYIESKESSDDKDAKAKANTEAIDAYFAGISKKKTKKWDEKKWMESLTSSLQASYKDVAEEMENYEVIYEKLRLPAGRLLQDISMDEITKEEDKTVNVVMVIDSSGSMKAKVGGESKMALAKKSIENLAKELPEAVNVSLVAFGHQGSGSDADKAKSCGAVETMYPLKAYEDSGFAESLKKFDAVGWTPLASGISMANEQLAAHKGENVENFIYVVSDGIETCDGDPVAAAKKAVADNTNVKINIIGFDVDTEADRQLKAVADAGGGEYSSVKTKQQLAEIKDVWKEAININTWRWWAVHRFADNVWTTLDHYNAVGKINSKYNTTFENERKRITEALDRLEKEEFIDAVQRNALNQVLRDRDDKIRTYMNDLDSKKRDEIKTKSDELSEKLDVIKKQVGV